VWQAQASATSTTPSSNIITYSRTKQRTHDTMAAFASVDNIASPYEIIFSCSICQATITDIYRDVEGDLGFNATDGSDQERVVTKLWLTECSHLTCAKHLEGGGTRNSRN
jgi:hypothetical protein